MLLGLNQYGTPDFTIASAPAAGLQFVGTTIGTSSALDSVLEIEFNQNPPLTQNLVTATYSAGHGDLAPVPLVASIPRPNVLRLTTTNPRQTGYYNFTLASQLTASGAPEYLSCTLSSNTVGGSPTLQAAGPVTGAAGVSLNASTRIVFGAPINPLTVTDQSASLSVGGAGLAVRRTFPQNTQEIILTPLKALPPNSTVSVLLTGLQDMAGRTIPDASWSFTTGADVDYVSPLVLSTSLPGNGSVVQIAATEAVQLVFSKPIDPGLTANIGSGGWSNNAATSTLSSDLRVLTIAPVNSWAKGQQYNIDLNLFTDLSGNVGSFASGISSVLQFQVAFDASLTPANLAAVSPPDGSTAMPLNARLMASFDRPVTAPPGGVTLTDSNSNSMPLEQMYWRDPSVLVFAPAVPLRADTAYTLSISGVSDLSGNTMSTGVTAGFVTGEAPDYVSPSGNILIVSPLPTNMPIRVRFNKAISPATVTPGEIHLFKQIAPYMNVPQPITVTVSSDDLSITVTPGQPLVAGQTYSLQMSAPADFAGNNASIGNPFNGSATFVAGGAADTTPPVVTIFPPDGTTGFPASYLSGYTSGTAQLAVTFSEPADLLDSPPLLQVLSNGIPVPGTVNTTSAGITFLPSPPLQHSTTYQIQVSGVADYAGNAAATTTSTFTTSQSATADLAKFQVASMQPADGSVGVPDNAPIVIAFSKVITPQMAGAIWIASSSPLPVYGQWSLADAYTLQFTPTEPWPSAATISVNISNYSNYGNPQDASGIRLDRSYTFSFTTAVSADTTPPTLASITPAAGTALAPIGTTFTLVFSKPVIVGSQAIQAFNGSQNATVNTYYSQTSDVIAATVSSVTPSSVLTLVGTAGIVDDSGNPITPFSYQYPTLATNPNVSPAVSSISPGYGSILTPNTPIEIQFNKPMDPASLLASLHVTQDGGEITSQLHVQMLDSNQSLQFTPGAPYNPGSRIDVFVLTTATDASGVPLDPQYQVTFTVASSTGQSAQMQRMSVALVGFGESVDLAAALDLAFDRDLDPSTVGENVWLRVGRLRIPGTAVLLGSRAIRFQPSEPLRMGEQYVLTAGPNLRSVEGLSNRPREFRLRADTGGPEVAVESIEYVRDPAPLAVRIRFNGAVNPISAAGLKVLAPDGSSVPVSVRFSTDGREWLLALPKSQPVRVLLDGVEDLQGRTLPNQSREPVVAR